MLDEMPGKGVAGPQAQHTGAFFEAVQQAGYELTEDVNGYRQEGFAPFDRNVKNGRRWSAARAYLHPVMGRAGPRHGGRVAAPRQPPRGVGRGLAWRA